MHNQPFLHELVTAVAAPATVLSGQDGQIRPHGAQGWLVSDVRHLSELTVTLDDQEPVALGHRQEGPATLRFVAAARHLGDELAEPTVRVERRRRTEPGHLHETIELVNDSRREITTTVRVRAAADLVPVIVFRAGHTPAPVPPRTPFTWVNDDTGTTLTCDRDPDRADGGVFAWDLRLPARTRVSWTLTFAATGPALFTAPATRPAPPAVTSRDAELTALFRTGAEDLAHLLLADGDDVFAGAGAPWYLTLFGRDSLWTARFALPFGTDLALGTLRALARHQGTRHDPASAEEPGKIPHELRGYATQDGGIELPPVYYGTIDATALWISLLHDAWRWGADVSGLLDPLHRALGWVLSHEGFLAYRDEHGSGLSNQGWKDSNDAVQDRHGVLAQAPVALSEAQAYAHRAALDAAAVLDAHGQPGAAAAREWAAGMNTRFRAAFWVRDETGPFPALALDAHGNPVDALASNMGHLLGSGLLTAEEAALVAARLGDQRMDSGYGLRTLDGTHPHFNPLGYHTGSVWPHDTAIAVDGLAREGHHAQAAALAAGVVRAGTRFAHRLPELYGGWSADDGPLLAYPSTCRPQAWSATSAFAFVTAALGLTPDAAAGTLAVRPSPAFAAWFPMVVDGLSFAGRRLRVEVDAEGGVTTDGFPVGA